MEIKFYYGWDKIRIFLKYMRFQWSELFDILKIIPNFLTLNRVFKA